MIHCQQACTRLMLADHTKQGGMVCTTPQPTMFMVAVVPEGTQGTTELAATRAAVDAHTASHGRRSSGCRHSLVCPRTSAQACSKALRSCGTQPAGLPYVCSTASTCDETGGSLPVWFQPACSWLELWPDVAQISSTLAQLKDAARTPEFSLPKDSSAGVAELDASLPG